jgi:outer membrane biosynthesis protein TonB
LVSGLVVSGVLAASIPGFSQAQPSQTRVPQQVVINGQTVIAVHVVAASGGFQAYTCLNPQQYTTVDGSSQGWACYEQSTGVWLLNALPPAQASQPAPTAQPVPPAPQVQVQPLPPPAPQPQAQPWPQAQPLPQPQPPAVYYPQQAPTIIYQQPPTIIYGSPVYPAPPVVYAPAYPSSVVLGTAAINAASRIISSAFIGYHRYPRVYYAPVRPYPYRGWRR